MKKLFLLAVLIPFLLSAQDDVKNKTMLFMSNQTDSIPYRIPALPEQLADSGRMDLLVDILAALEF